MVNHRRFVEVTSWFGVKVEFSAYNWAVDVRVPECYADLVEGLCGNYNGNRNDDVRARGEPLVTRLNIADFGQSWKTGGDGPNCEAGPTEFPECTNQEVKNTCNAIGDDSGIFKRCASVASVEHAIMQENCVFDYCLDNTMKCGIFENYAKTCLAELAGSLNKDDELCKWAEKSDCAPKCGPNSSFSACANLCEVRTCANRNDENTCPTNARFTSMCMCDEGYLLQDGVCIKEEDCGCIMENGASVANGYESTDCEKSCKCEKGEFKCEPLPANSCKPECGCVQGQYFDYFP